MLSRQNGTEVEASVPFYMITLLAESKTMVSETSEVSQLDFENHKPVLESIADSIMDYIATLSPAELADKLGISHSLAIKAHNLAYDFPHKQTGYNALQGFIGDAYRGLDAGSLPEKIIDNADKSLRIISSVYGILKPSDIIKPYRCEFNKSITKDNKTSIQIFKPKVTVELVNLIKNNKIKDVIDLLPTDADKCVDWKIIRAFASVNKIVFQTISEDGKLKTPIAKRLKELRGLMARTILQQDIVSFNDLKNIKSDHFIYSPADSKPGLPIFIC